ncbi:hypothetical protein KSS87_013914 [Heliosperma pusillum]|nr:hypothetical protein KSS87_013914 [Heliosperma pusillum]
MSLPSFITHCLHCNSLCEQCVFLPSLPIACIVTPCVNNESSLLHYPLFAL